MSNFTLPVKGWIVLTDWLRDQITINKTGKELAVRFAEYCREYYPKYEKYATAARIQYACRCLELPYKVLYEQKEAS